MLYDISCFLALLVTFQILQLRTSRIAIYSVHARNCSLPLSNSSIGATPSGVSPAEVGVLGSILPDQLFVHLDTETRCGQQLDGSVLDVKDLGVLQVGEQVKVTSIVVHLTRARGRFRC